MSFPEVGFGTKTQGVYISVLIFRSYKVDGDSLLGSIVPSSVAQITRSVF